MNIKTNECNDKRADRISKQLNISKYAAKLLVGRGLSESTIKLLVSSAPLEEKVNELPFIEKATNKMIAYLSSNSKIYIYGDYDSDGVNATYIMYNALLELAEAYECGCEVYYYIPERSEGYGLNIDWCKSIVKDKNSTDKTLVITVDNGITKLEEVEYLNFHGIETIITDHHKPQPYRTPDGIVIDAWLHTDDENYTGLCGASVAYKIVKYLYTEMLGYDEAYITKYLPHAAIATITDMMPVTEENIILIKNGLKLINDYPYKNMDFSPVSEAMYYFADFNKNEDITPKDIAFGLGPQINSCGRLGNIQLAANFLLSKDYEEIEHTYNEVLKLNDERKALNAVMVESIVPPGLNDYCIVQYEQALGGLAGNVANKAIEKYNIPIVLLTGDDDIVTGSARSLEGIDLQSMLRKEKELGHILDFGGHECACGLSLKKDMIDTFKNSLNKQISKLPTSPIIDDTIYVDRIVKAKELTSYVVNDYKDILFFNDFKKPVFYIENVDIETVSYSKNNPNNICFYFTDETTKVNKKVWSWGFGETYKELGEPKKVNMVFTLEKFKGMLVADIHIIEAC